MKGRRSFYRLAFSTLVAVYVLIMVGGVVRSTGSGMGCPDWPRCFGNWVPPTDVSQLPSNYKEIYSEYRHKKNERFARYLTAFGMEDTANKILTDESIREEADFNPVKTLIEYVNRIIGVIIGFLIFLVFAFSLRFWNTARSWTFVAFLTFFMVGFQGWIGSFVVSTNLTPWVITVHMFLALLIVAMLLYLVYQAGEWSREHTAGITGWLVACMLMVLAQIYFGTRVREAVDVVAASGAVRSNWIEGLGSSFIIHRTFSWVVLLAHVVFVWKLMKSGVEKRFALGLILLILGTLLSGIGMAWFAVPPYLQPVHLTLATITFGVQFLLLLKLRLNTRATVAVS